MKKNNSVEILIITHDWVEYLVPDIENKALIKLILNTDSLDYSEKQFWFNSLSYITHEQIKRLFDILEDERIKLEELDIKYQKEINDLILKYSPNEK